MAITLKDYQAVTNAIGQTLYVEKKTFDLVYGLLEKEGSHIVLFGERGTAKTEFAGAVFAKIGIPVFQSEFGAISSGEQLDGERTIDDNGKLTNVPTQLLLAIQSAALGVPVGLLADELNRVQSAAAANKLLRLFAQGEYVTDLHGVLKIAPGNLKTIATMNIGYHGTVRLNEALLDRFDPIEMRAIGGEVLAKMLSERFPTIDKKIVTKVVSLVDKTRSAAMSDEDIVGLSTRDAIRILRGVRIGFSPVEAIAELIGGQLRVLSASEAVVEGLVAQAKAMFPITSAA